MTRVLGRLGAFKALLEQNKFAFKRVCVCVYRIGHGIRCIESERGRRRQNATRRKERTKGETAREGESGGTVEVTENREINRQPIPPFTRRVSFIGSDNKKSVTEINWRTSRSIISELSSFLYRRGVVTRQRKRYTCAQRWGTNVAGISLYTYTLRDTIRIRESHVVRISRRSRMETRLSFSPTWNRDSVKMYFIRARSVELLDIGIRRIRISIVAYFLDAWRRFACFITTLDTCTLAVRIS